MCVSVCARACMYVPVCAYVCVYLWRCRRRRMMLSVHCSTPRSYRSNCKSRKGEGGQERRGEEGWMLERLEQIECRSGEQWEGETNRISLKGAETQRVMKVFLLLAWVVFYLSICSGGLKWHKATMFRPRCTSAQFQTSHLSHYAFTVCACVYVWRMSVYKPLCALTYLCLFVCVWAHVCFEVYVQHMNLFTGVCVRINLRNHSWHGGVAYHNRNELVSRHQVFSILGVC